MGNPITDSSKLTNLIVSQCCCCAPLRSGTLTIGIIQIIIAILYIIGAATSKGSGNGYIGLVSTILTAISGIFAIIAYRQVRKDFLFYAVYINIVLTIWSIIFAIIAFVSILIGLGIASLISAVIELYFAVIFRSYAFEIESGGTAATNPA